ncbi:MAG: hypothetical protein DRP56_01255 [Planctomycetota bacterium]|nr:MAG: hypothetical protein DRP56_01255 [Planctomycetota bacterium]
MRITMIFGRIFRVDRLPGNAILNKKGKPMGIKLRIAQAMFGKQFVHSAVVSNFLNIFGWNPAKNPEVLIRKVKGWAYTCINRNAMACSQIPLRLYRIKGVKGKAQVIPVKKKKQAFLRQKLAERVAGAYELEEVTDHPILDLLRQVNPYQNAFDLKNQSFQFLEAIANAFWYKERGADGEVINIWPLLAQKVKILPDKLNGIRGFQYGTGENKETYAPEDIVHFRNSSLTDPFWGDSALAACEQAVDLYDYMNRFEIASFKNGGRPGVILEIPVDGFVDPEERKRMESDFRKKYKGVDKTGKFMVTSGGGKLKEFGFSPKEMSFMKGRTATLEEICGAFGVPISFVKIQEISRANMFASLDLWSQYTINPRLVQFEQKLNEQFTPDFGEGLFLLFDDARPKDAEFRLKEIESHLTSKYTSVNEERENDGLDPVDWGESPIEAPNPIGEPEPPKKQAAVDASAIDSIEVKQDGPGNPLPKPDYMPVVFRTQLTILFKEIESEICKRLDQQKSISKDIENDIVSSIFDKKKWEDRLENDMLPFLKGIMVQGVIDSLEKLNPSAVYNASSPAVLQALEARRGQMKTIIATTEKEIRGMLKDGIELGESRGQLIKRIRSNFDARHKADRVVRTESIWAHNEGTMQGWKQSGVVAAKKWDTAEDERTCPFCNSMHGKIVEIDESYIDNDDTIEADGQSLKIGYGNVDHPPLHPGCRCSILPVLIED